MAATTTTAALKKTALILGVANHRSIAWACVESFLRDYDRIVFTYQSERFAKTANDLILQLQQSQQAQTQAATRFAAHHSTTTTSSSSSHSSHSSLPSSIRPPPLVVALACNVETELASLFHERIPQAFQDKDNDTTDDYTLDAIVHSIAYAPDMNDRGLLHTSREAFLQAHAVSAYSLLETTQLALPMLQRKCTSSSKSDEAGGAGSISSSSSSITTLSYIGAMRAVPHYNAMGPAKASLEALVRGLAREIGAAGQNNNDSHHHSIRINAVSAGPLNTMAARGIAGMTQLRQHYEQHAPLLRNVTAREVADTVRFVASTEATGMTGQTIYVDGGYSCIVPV